jgi:hypothetical protein
MKSKAITIIEWFIIGIGLALGTMILWGMMYIIGMVG